MKSRNNRRAYFTRCSNVGWHDIVTSILFTIITDVVVRIGNAEQITCGGLNLLLRHPTHGPIAQMPRDEGLHREAMPSVLRAQARGANRANRPAYPPCFALVRRLFITGSGVKSVVGLKPRIQYVQNCSVRFPRRRLPISVLNIGRFRHPLGFVELLNLLRQPGEPLKPCITVQASLIFYPTQHFRM